MALLHSRALVPNHIHGHSHGHQHVHCSFRPWKMGVSSMNTYQSPLLLPSPRISTCPQLDYVFSTFYAQRTSLSVKAVSGDGAGPSDSDRLVTNTPKPNKPLISMSRRTVLTGMVAGMAFASCPCCQQLGAAHADEAAPHWDYSECLLSTLDMHGAFCVLRMCMQR